MWLDLGCSQVGAKQTVWQAVLPAAHPLEAALASLSRHHPASVFSQSLSYVPAKMLSCNPFKSSSNQRDGWPAFVGLSPAAPCCSLRTRLPEGPALTAESVPAGPPNSPSMWPSPGSPSLPMGTHPAPQSPADHQMAPGGHMGSSRSRAGLGQMTGMLQGQLQQPGSYSMRSTLHAPSGGDLLKEQRASTGEGLLCACTPTPCICPPSMRLDVQRAGSGWGSCPPPPTECICLNLGLPAALRWGSLYGPAPALCLCLTLKLLDEQRTDTDDALLHTNDRFASCPLAAWLVYQAVAHLHSPRLRPATQSVQKRSYVF